MAMLTRSRARAAAGGGPNTSHTPTPQNQTHAAVYEKVVQGANGNRVSTRGRGAKRSSALTQSNIKEGEESTSTTSRPITASNSKPRRNAKGKRRESQPQATVQSTTQTCGLAFEFTVEYVAKPGKTASPPETDGAASKKPRKGGRTTTKRGTKAKAKAKTGGASQQKKETQSTAVASAGTKRRREDDDFEPEESGEDELEPAPVRRTSRRVRRKTAEDAVNLDAVGEAMNRVRGNKGKAKAIDLPPTEEATTGSKRRRDEDDDVGDASQQPLDPGPSRRTTRRTRQKVENPTVGESEKKTARKPRGGRTTAARPTRRTGKTRASRIQVPRTRASTPMSCESEEPTIMPSRAPSPEECKVEEHPVPQESSREAVVKQEEVTPSPFPRQPPSRQPDCKREPPVSPFMLPALQSPLATIWQFANPPSHVGGLIIKADGRSSAYLDQDQSLSPGGSDKENDPIYVPMPAPIPAPEPDSDSDDDNAQDENGPSDQSIKRPHPRRPLEPLEGFDTSVPEGDETEPVSSEDEEVDYIDLEEVIAPATAGSEFRLTTAQREVPSCGCSVDGPNDEVEVAPDSHVSSHFQHPAEESLSDPRRWLSREVREILEASSSFYRRMICRDLDQSALQEHESPEPPVARLENIPDTPSAPLEAAVPDGRDVFTRSRAPSPSPSLPDNAA